MESKKINLNIGTNLSLKNGSNLIEVGSILQNFTNKYLYVKNNKLYGINKLDDIIPSHYLVGYDGGFQLLCKNMKTTLHCFRKELADYLNTHNKSMVHMVPTYEPIDP